MYQNMGVQNTNHLENKTKYAPVKYKCVIDDVDSCSDQYGE
jgi:hypothetical protein